MLKISYILQINTSDSSCRADAIVYDLWRREEMSSLHKCPLTHHKVPSGQIGSALVVPLDRLEKDINRYSFFDFIISVLNIWKDLKVLTHFIQKLIQPPASSEQGLYRILSSWRTSICWKKLPKCCTILFGLWNILHRSRFGARFGGKDCSLCTYKPCSKQAGGWIHYCMKRLRTLKVFFRNSILKLKNQKL